MCTEVVGAFALETVDHSLALAECDAFNFVGIVVTADRRESRKAMFNKYIGRFIRTLELQGIQYLVLVACSLHCYLPVFLPAQGHETEVVEATLVGN